MKITFFSSVSAIAWCSFFITLIYFLRKRNAAKHSVFLLIGLYFASMVRTVLPLDLPAALVLSDSRFYPVIYQWLTAERWRVGIYPISVSVVLLLLWAAGACAGIARYWFRYFRFIRCMTAIAEPADGVVLSVFAKIAGSEKQRSLISVRMVPELGTPCTVGVFRRMILLPKADYTEDTLYYILMHEYTHITQHDVLLKQFSVLFSLVFWWNPAVYLLRKDLEQAIEVKCDAIVTRNMAKPQKIAYLQTLLAFLQANPDSTMYGTAAFLKNLDSINMRERFDAVTTHQKIKKSRLQNRLLLCVFFLLFALSYAMILQPQIEAPNSQDLGFCFDSTNAQIVQKANGKYALCLSENESIEISEDRMLFYQENGFQIIKE